MRTTIDLPDELFREVKTRAAQQGTTLKKLMIEFVRSGLYPQTSSCDEAPARRPPPPVAIKRIQGLPRSPVLTNRQLYALLENEELMEGVGPREENETRQK